jgi:cytochrome c553
MKPVLANLTEQDLVAIAAYVSSRVPPGAASANPVDVGRHR